MSYFVYSYGNPRALHVLPHPFLTRRSSVLDVRDFSLMAYGAAGGMLLPAALDLIPLRAVVIPPHPGLFSALGLLSTDQVFHESESAYVVFSPDSAERSEEHTSELQSLMRISYAVFCLTKTNTTPTPC